MKTLNLQVMSDLHLEFHKDKGHKFIDSLDPSGVDILMLAGDCFSLRGSFIGDKNSPLKQLVEKYPQVFYVAGNHEFYGLSLDEGQYNLWALQQEFPNLQILHSGKVVRVAGYKFIGDTMWFPYDPKNEPYYGWLSDFSAIREFVPKVYDIHDEAFVFLQQECDSNTVVMTHHTPSYKSCAPHWHGQPLNAFFHVPQAEYDIIIPNQPKLWIHGHTHDSFDYQIGATRVVCNPKGYLRERKREDFNEKLVIQLEVAEDVPTSET